MYDGMELGLKELGYEVFTVNKLRASGVKLSGDLAIYEYAKENKMVIVTGDKKFGRELKEVNIPVIQVSFDDVFQFVRQKLESYKDGNMIVTGWNNGEHHPTGAGYGFKVDVNDRDNYFKKEWEYVILKLQGDVKEVVVNIDKPSFWSDACRELISKEIGIWLIRNKKAPWPTGNPPKMRMEQIDDNRFEVEFI